MAISSALLLFVVSIFNVTFAHPQNHGLISRATSGCGKTPILPILVPFRTLESSGKRRIYKFHLPESYDVNKPYPIVVGFHGSSSVGTFFELDTKMNEKRYSGDKIMIYPDGLGGSWAGPSYHKDSTVAEDVQFVGDLIEHVKGEFCVDEEKVFGVGYVLPTLIGPT
jgi:poly(3-hydroxybutyrate) depolymerase